MAGTEFDALLERMTQARDAGQPVEQALRMAADFLDVRQPELPDARREQLRAQLKALIEHGPLVQAVAEAESDDSAMVALLNVLAALQAAEPKAQQDARIAEVLRVLSDARSTTWPKGQTQQAAGMDWLWGEPTDDPGTLDFGPAISEWEIEAWESRYRVSLPPVLKQAYHQQNGGMVRGQRLFLYRLEEVEPIEEDYFESVGAGAPAAYDPALTFVCGYDDAAGATLLLAYRSEEDLEPVFYGYWSDGGSVAWTAEPAAAMRGELE